LFVALTVKERLVPSQWLCVAAMGVVNNTFINTSTQFVYMCLFRPQKSPHAAGLSMTVEEVRWGIFDNKKPARGGLLV
jgi:hypothetical protein